MKNNKYYILLIIVLLLIFSFLVYYIINDNQIPSEEINVGDKIMTEQEALTLGENIYNKISLIYLNNDEEIEKDNNNQIIYYQKTNNTFVVNKTKSFDGIGENVPYVKLIINDFMDILSTKQFKNFCDELSIIEYQGNYYREDQNRGAVLNYANTELKVISVSNDKIEFEAISYYYLDAYDAYNNANYTNVETEQRINKFELILENNKWKVNEFTMPY